MIDAKEYLKQIARDNAVIENKLAEIRQLESLATNISSVVSDTPVQSSGSHDRVGKLAADIADKKAELQLFVNELIDKRNERIKLIEQLDDYLEYQVIYQCYVNLKFLTIIAKEEHYTYNYIQKKHISGLKKIEKIINSPYYSV